MASDELSNKIVLIEDDSDMQEALLDVLRRRRYEVISLRRGEGAKEVVEDEKPHLVILDLALPDTDGVNVLHEIKDYFDTRKTKFIVVSAYTSRLDHTAHEKVVDVFTKPFDMERFLSVVDEAMSTPAED